MRKASGLLFLLALAVPAARAADAPAPADGIFVTVPNPITSEVYNRVKETTERYVQRAKSAEGGPRELRVIYDFNPDNKPAGTREFGPCRDLAKYLLRQHDVRTVAFVHAETTRHTVLPVLACRDIIMSSGAKLGDVRRDEDPKEALDSDVVEAYRNVVKDRRCPAVALKMLDSDMEVVRAKRAKADGDWYIDKRREAEERKDGVFVLNPEPVVPAGEGSTLYTQKQAEQLGLVVLTKENRQEIIAAYDLGPASLREDPLMGRNPVAWRIEVRGPVTDGLAETVERQIDRAIGQKANLIFLELECGGGNTLVARDLAVWLRERKDDKGEYPVMTVAYIPKSAPDTAAFLALGCTEIVMHRDAKFGDFSAIITEKRDGGIAYVDPSQYKAKRESLEELARQQGYPVLLARGMMDRELEVYHARNNKTNEWAFLTGEELAADRAAGAGAKWSHEQLVKAGGVNGKALVLSADEAVQWRLATHKVEDINELYALYGVSPTQVQTASYDWRDQFAEFLRRPVTRIFLVMIGIVCLLLELKMPGVGVPGVIAAVCFVLFFWAHWGTGGLDLLALLLFLLGLVLIGLEIFVFPGTAVVGISGVVLVVLSLALAALEKWPQSPGDWTKLLENAAWFGLALVGAVLLAVLLVSYLPNIPYLNRLILKPKTDPELVGEEQPADTVRPEVAALLGAIGVAATPLRPAGKVKFGDEYIDVVAEGAYVEPGTRVQVVEIEGNRIVVKEVL
jgi:membrane-bound ClpP family serine protease